MADATNRPSVLVGVLHVGEPSLPRVLDRIRAQADVDVELLEIGHHPEREAHARLYRAFDDASASGTHDALVKVDADMELVEPGLLRALATMFRNNMRSTGHADDHLRFVVGPVEETLRTEKIPQRIALLRLDTDWYESTRVELEVLLPRLSPGGVLIIDDYNHWAGSRRAVDEHFTAHAQRPIMFPVGKGSVIATVG